MTSWRYEHRAACSCLRLLLVRCFCDLLLAAYTLYDQTDALVRADRKYVKGHMITNTMALMPLAEPAAADAAEMLRCGKLRDRAEAIQYLQRRLYRVDFTPAPRRPFGSLRGSPHGSRCDWARLLRGRAGCCLCRR